MRTRGFEIVGAYAGKGINIPVRETACSAGYDLAAAEDVTLPPHQVTLVPTGLKAYMQPDEYLLQDFPRQCPTEREQSSY